MTGDTADTEHRWHGIRYRSPQIPVLTGRVIPNSCCIHCPDTDHCPDTEATISGRLALSSHNRSVTVNALGLGFEQVVDQIADPLASSRSHEPSWSRKRHRAFPAQARGIWVVVHSQKSFDQKLVRNPAHQPASRATGHEPGGGVDTPHRHHGVIENC